jgi:hypothetical protein
MEETLVPTGTAGGQESELSGQAANAKGPRKSLEDQLAEIRAQEKKVIDKIKQRDKELRAQYEKDLWALLKSEKWDEVPIETWRAAAKSIGSALKAAK